MTTYTTTVPRRPGLLAAAVRGSVTLTALALAIGLAGGTASPDLAHARPDAVPGDAPGPASPVASAAAPINTDERWVFPSRPDVCGTGDGIIIRAGDGSTSYLHGRSHTVRLGRWNEGDPPCESGVVVVDLAGPSGARTDVRLTVTSEARVARAAPAGLRLDAAAAAARLLGEARTARDARVARRLVMGAALADAEVWPGLLELARDRSLERRTRESAIHWLGRQAAAAVAPALDDLVRDPTEADEIRDAAVFALSQLSEERAIPLLIELVRTSDDARVRSRALFWLAEFDDPRAIALFEEILAGPGA